MSTASLQRQSLKLCLPVVTASCVRGLRESCYLIGTMDYREARLDAVNHSTFLENSIERLFRLGEEVALQGRQMSERRRWYDDK
jgi:hypothetical protein